MPITKKVITSEGNVTFHIFMSAKLEIFNYNTIMELKGAKYTGIIRTRSVEIRGKQFKTKLVLTRHTQMHN